MKVRQSALCFVFLLSSQYLLGVAAQVASAQKKEAAISASDQKKKAAISASDQKKTAPISAPAQKKAAANSTSNQKKVPPISAAAQKKMLPISSILDQKKVVGISASDQKKAAPISASNQTKAALISASNQTKAAPISASAQKKVAAKRKPIGHIGSSRCNSDCSSGCVLKPSLVKKLDQAFENIRDSLPNSILIDNTTVENSLQAIGDAIGFKDFRIGPYTCACVKGAFDRIYVDVSFLQILFDFILHILEDPFGGLLGPLGKALAIILDGVVKLLVRVLSLNTEVQITILLEHANSTASIENFTITCASDITLLGLNISFLTDLLSPILKPFLNLLLEIMLEGPVKAEFEKELQKLVFTEGDRYCKE